MKDILLNDAGDLQISSNDLVIGRSNVQHQCTLIITQPCSFVESPDVGIGAEDFLNGDDDNIAIVTREQFTKDGQNVAAIAYDTLTGDLTYNADYYN